jgi:hypothetical protein
MKASGAALGRHAEELHEAKRDPALMAGARAGERWV